MPQDGMQDTRLFCKAARLTLGEHAEECGVLVVDRGVMHDVCRTSDSVDPAAALHEGGTPVDGSVRFKSSGPCGEMTLDHSWRA